METIYSQIRFGRNNFSWNFFMFLGIQIPQKMSSRMFLCFFWVFLIPPSFPCFNEWFTLLPNMHIHGLIYKIPNMRRDQTHQNIWSTYSTSMLHNGHHEGLLKDLLLRFSLIGILFVSKHNKLFFFFWWTFQFPNELPPLDQLLRFFNYISI